MPRSAATDGRVVRGAEVVGSTGRRDISPPGSWLRERGWLLDVLVTVGVFVYNLPIFPVYASGPVHLVGLLGVSLGMCVPFLWRRRYPRVALGIMLAAACVQLVLGVPILPVDAILLFAVYNVATRFAWPVSVPAAALTVVWLLVAVLPGLGEGFLDVGELGVLVIMVVWVWTWGTLVRTRRDYMSGLRERAEQSERERETRAEIAVADERARIAREIHDVVSHGLTVVAVMSDGAAAKVDAEPERARSAMLTVRDTSRTALTEMRRMLNVLREDEPGSHAPQPGLAQLDGLIEDSRAAGLPVSLAVEGSPVEVSATVGLAVYRLVQEALTNVRSHAGPSVRQVEVVLSYGQTSVAVRVRDDGRGAGQDRALGDGHGLVGMRERVAVHGGTVRAGPRPSGGFEVWAELPMGEDT